MSLDGTTHPGKLRRVELASETTIVEVNGELSDRCLEEVKLGRKIICLKILPVALCGIDK